MEKQKRAKTSGWTVSGEQHRKVQGCADRPPGDPPTPHRRALQPDDLLLDNALLDRLTPVSLLLLKPTSSARLLPPPAYFLRPPTSTVRLPSTVRPPSLLRLRPPSLLRLPLPPTRFRPATSSVSPPYFHFGVDHRETLPSSRAAARPLCFGVDHRGASVPGPPGRPRFSIAVAPPAHPDPVRTVRLSPFFLAKLTLLEGSIGYGPIVKAFTLPLSQVIPVPGCSQHLRSLSLSGNVNPLQRAETYPRFLS